MDPKQKIVTTTLWGFLVLVMLAVVGSGLRAHRGGAEQADLKLKRLWEVPSFSLTDENGRTVTNESLRGKTWVACFLFTHCAGDCPMMTKKFAALQQATAGTDLRLVSFTVDPERDTPEVLKGYAKRNNADENRWSLLTGTTEQIAQIAKEMKVAFAPATATTPIIHGDWFLLVDVDGWVRGSYHSKVAEDQRKLAEDALALSARGGRAP